MLRVSLSLNTGCGFPGQRPPLAARCERRTASVRSRLHRPASPWEHGRETNTLGSVDRHRYSGLENPHGPEPGARFERR
ncbi:hypothetical protein DB31_6134 [Hyalangium minutum]|uniref:Uncharacterized protein n=1 Tax=Hyalangium minutum TaxID=394096 RepID=A0A085VVS9_9BACT|nr:hypothetical protein DB31_6134 [Hyalangium minutum]